MPPGDNAQRRLENGLGHPEALGQDVTRRVWMSRGEVGDVAELRSPERVNRLVGVAGHREIAARPGEESGDFRLHRAGVLVLVYQDISVLLSQVLASFGLQQVDRRHQQHSVVGTACLV